MNNKEIAKIALEWYAGHQGNWVGIVNRLDDYFERNIDKTICVLETWPQKYHYGAMLYLRLECNCEIWGEDTPDNTSMNYRMRNKPSDDWYIITPIFKRDYVREEKFMNKLMDIENCHGWKKLPKIPKILLKIAQQGDAPESGSSE